MSYDSSAEKSPGLPVGIFYRARFRDGDHLNPKRAEVCIQIIKRELLKDHPSDEIDHNRLLDLLCNTN